MIQAKLPKQHSKYQEGNFEEKCAFWKIVCFLISFPNNQQKKFSSVCICLSAILESCFLQKRGKLDFFSFPEGVCFANFSGHWMRTLMQSGNLLKQFHQNCSLRSLCNFFVKKVFFVRFHQSSFLDVCWKKLGLLSKIFLVLLRFSHLWLERYFLSPEDRLSWFFVKKMIFSLFGTLSENIFVLWRRFSAGLSKLQSLCPEEHSDESLSIDKFVSSLFLIER